MDVNTTAGAFNNIAAPAPAMKLGSHRSEARTVVGSAGPGRSSSGTGSPGPGPGGDTATATAALLSAAGGGAAPGF